MNKVADWEPRWIGNTANGFFKSIIRKHPCEDCWSWTLEWNTNYRLIGFFGALEPAQKIVNNFSSIKMTDVPPGKESSSTRYREDVKLPVNNDLLFFWED